MSDHQKPDLENQDEQGLMMANQRWGRQHQRRLNFVPTQGDAAPNISQTLRKKKSANIDLQRVRNNRTNGNS
ncbi:hypothetical protein DY000_02024435 [Brassica cretica]|uniref:Uncharacterized protein n=1 Tax=Brassica cretica TaxID=69181 RepID=A0ABQ7E5M3_BRACR|nr:hypothetical protein DY000_02024435 [Brassica cretica]